MMNILRMTALALSFLAYATVAPATAASPDGIWSMSNGKVIVRVANCGSNLCANIVGLKEPISKIDGKPKVDRANPDPAKRGRPLIGLSILIGMKPAGPGHWEGAIYNPDDGQTYSATVSNDGGDKMLVMGCVAAIFCKTNTFVRSN